MTLDEETTRFFIGKNIHQPKAFGIYKKGKNFIVYKNKANGLRSIRYKGEDEEFAVNEIITKLKEEILKQKKLNERRRQEKERKQTSYNTYSKKTYNTQKKNITTKFIFWVVIL